MSRIEQPRSATRPPPPVNGDRLTLAEFRRRSAQLPEGAKVELLDGEVYATAATRRRHGTPQGLVATWLGTYAAATPGTEMSDNATLRLDETSEPMPDLLLCILPESGGIAREDDEGYWNGPVELVAEIALSSASIDLGKKKAIYLRNGIREYVVLVVHEGRVHWFSHEAGEYVPLEADGRGVIRSRVFPGLWLDVRAAVEGRAASVLAVLDRGLATKEHAAFRRGLRRRR